MILRYLLSTLMCLLALAPVAAPAVVRDNAAASQPVTFSDGAVATTYDHCGDADLCATVEYPSGEKLSIYSEGAAFCQPYMLHFVATHGGTTLYEFTRTLNHDPVTANAFGKHCGNNQATQMTLTTGWSTSQSTSTRTVRCASCSHR